jgi:hypothetical protein
MVEILDLAPSADAEAAMSAVCRNDIGFVARAWS